MMSLSRPVPPTLLAAAFLTLASSASSQVVFDFEDPSWASSPIVGGDVANFVRTTDQALAGSHSLQFDYSNPDPFRSFTYDMPFELTEGTVSIWFYDALGAAFVQDPPGPGTEMGGAIILEDANNPADFGAIEINNFPYPFPFLTTSYYATEGEVDRGTTGGFDSGFFGPRSIGWHQVTFNVGPTETTISIGASTSTIARAPGGDKTLRLRIMTGSPTLGGQGNYINDPLSEGLSIPSRRDWVSYDDLAITATAPAANTHTNGFEIIGDIPEYDAAAEFMVSAANDNPFMQGWVGAYGPTTDAPFVRTGARAAKFIDQVPSFKSITFDLSGAQPGTATIWFYDAFGPDDFFDKFGGSVMIEEGNEPGNFMAVEIWTAEYPFSGDPSPGAPNYYLTKQSVTGAPPVFDSRYFGNRQVGWNRIDVVLTETTSRFIVNGIENADGAGNVVTGPGLDTNPKLRLMADSATAGGFSNYTTLPELDQVFLIKDADYVYYDSISLPLAASSVSDWQLLD